MYLLDTNVVSELRRGDRTDQKVIAWSESISSKEAFLSVTTIFELERGVLSVARKDRQKGETLRRWMDGHVLQHYRGRILNVDIDVARECARLHVPRTRPERDAMIAATALVHKMTVVTRNEADFKVQGLRVLNPWK